MTIFNCENKWNCTGIAVVASLILGIIAAFLQITGVITIAPVALVVALGIAVVYLAVILVTASLAQHSAACRRICNTLSVLLFSILGTILFSIILLAITFAATSVIGALFVGALVFFFALTLISTACFAKCLLNCED